MNGICHGKKKVAVKYIVAVKNIFATNTFVTVK